MKLTTERVEQALAQVEAKALPEDHPAVPELTRLFGEHTYFLDRTGLLIIEPMDDEPSDRGTQAATVVKLASWADAGRTSLEAHQPEPTDVVVILDMAA